MFQPTQNKPAIAILVIIVIGFLVTNSMNTRSKAIDEVQKLLREYKTAKALNILEQLKGSSQAKDKDLDTLIFYTLVKSKNFNAATDTIKRIEYIPKKFSGDFNEIIEILTANNSSDLIALTLPKAFKLDLDENFFIDLANNINSLSAETRILEAGLDYYNKSSKSIGKDRFDHKKLKEYIVKRYLDIAEMNIGANKANEALNTLKRLENLGLINNSPQKSDYYLSLAMIYKALNQHDLAWDNVQLSAKLGNDRAKSMINSLDRKYKSEY